MRNDTAINEPPVFSGLAIAHEFLPEDWREGGGEGGRVGE